MKKKTWKFYIQFDILTYSNMNKLGIFSLEKICLKKVYNIHNMFFYRFANIFQAIQWLIERWKKVAY